MIIVSHIGGHTGLARVADNLLMRLKEHWRITVVAISTPTPDYQHPDYRIVQAKFGNDWIGRIVYQNVCKDDPPDVTVLYMDPSVVVDWRAFRHDTPLVAYMPVDAKNVRDAPVLNTLIDYGIFLSDFGLHETRQCGYTGPANVIGHGVDHTLYFPRDTQEARQRLGFPRDAFIVGNINRNQPRKRFEVTLLAFKAFLRNVQPAQECLLYCHCAPRDIGWDLPQLAQYFGIAEHVRFPLIDMSQGGLPESELSWVYSALDVQVSTCQGEGWGLTHIEGMACGIPQIVPDFAALAQTDWTGNHVLHVPARQLLVTVECSNLVAATPDPTDVAAAISQLYLTPAYRTGYAEDGRRWSLDARFDWDVLAQQFHDTLTEVRHGRTPRSDAQEYRGLAECVD